jgi:predicted metal-binding membrane protein
MAAAVMLNVALMNFCYDVPVKLYSTLYVLMALFLLLPDISPLFQFFLQRRDTRLRGVWVRRPERRPLRIAGYCLWALVIGHLLYMQVSADAKQWSRRRASAAGATRQAPNSETNAGYPLMTRGFHWVQEYPYSR